VTRIASSPDSRPADYRIGVDTGGTFTDVVVGDATAILAVGKALTTPARISKGILDGVAVAATALDTDVGTLLRQTALFVYGSTRATNAIIERKTAKTAFLTTEGFPDTLVRREGGKLNAWDFSRDYPEPYVPRQLTFEIRERITADGDVFVPFDVGQARDVVMQLQRLEVEAVAVCFLWSVANAKHELMMGELLKRELPGVPFTLSHQLNPIVREYRRGSSAAIDASLKPLMQVHLREMETDLRAAGLAGELLPAVSLGGVMHMADVIERPINMVRSGPALAPILGQVTAAAEVGAKEVIVCDTGGTSFDVSLVRGGRPVFSRETWLGGRYTGHLTGLSSVDARSIGAGGGSIAWIDSGGLLRVGPQSAGADPGPACYGRSGENATVTDAALVLGYLDPENFLGGRMPLDADAARAAVGRIAAVLNQSIDDAAGGILVIASEHMVDAIKEITINEGVDPRDSLLLAGGGAAGLNIVLIARELGCERVLIPRLAGALSACGAQYTDIVTEFGVNRLTRSRQFAYDAANEVLGQLRYSMDQFKNTLTSRGVQRFHTEYFVEARYRYQVWELEVPLATSEFRTADDIARVTDDFHAVHKSIFAVAETDQEVEFTHWKSRITGELDHPPLNPRPCSATVAPLPGRHARAFFKGTGLTDIPVHPGEVLKPGMTVMGPALVVEPTTTIVLYPGSSATVTALNNYMVEVGS
jgi:N-methylhydantoinase A